MKIAGIDVYVLKSDIDNPFGSSQGWIHQRSATLVRVSTDEGAVGWGEAFTQGPEPPEISAAAIEHALKPWLIGKDPMQIQPIWQEMYVRSRDFGRKGSVVSAISGIDMALWDLFGKLQGLPVHQLLGGAFRDEIQPYATGFFRLSGPGESKRLAEEACRHREAGFRAMKVKLGFGVRDDLEVMTAIREALDDAEIELMVDVNHAYGRAEALKLGRALEAFDLRWLEEPVVPEDIEGYAELRSKLAIPIAGGENEHSPYGFYPLIKAAGVDIVQPDVGSCGGITAARDIAAIAQAAGIAVNPHVWGSAVSQAASLHFIAALPTANARLFPQQPILEYDQSTHPFREHLVSKPIRMTDGMIPVPSEPGLGIEVQMDIVERYATG